MFHCNGWGQTYAVTGMGGRHIVLRKVDGTDILDRIEQHGINFACGAPAVVAMTLDAAEKRVVLGQPVPGRDLMRIVVAGAPPPSKTIERVETELGWEFIQIYGLTETSPLLTMNRSRAEYDDLTPADRARALSRAGAPAIGVTIKISKSDEICARSNVVFEGYWEQPEETAKAMPDGFFHTGDGGYLDGAYVVIADRKKDVIISGGENVSSIEVEDCLFQHPAIAECCVIGIPDPKWGETIKALVVLRDDVEAPTERELIDFCGRRSPTSNARRPWNSVRRWLAPQPGNCRSSNCVNRTGPARRRWSTDHEPGQLTRPTDKSKSRAWTAARPLPARRSGSRSIGESSRVLAPKANSPAVRVSSDHWVSKSPNHTWRTHEHQPSLAEALRRPRSRRAANRTTRSDICGRRPCGDAELRSLDHASGEADNQRHHRRSRTGRYRRRQTGRAAVQHPLARG